MYFLFIILKCFYIGIICLSVFDVTIFAVPPIRDETFVINCNKSCRVLVVIFVFSWNYFFFFNHLGQFEYI